MLIVIISNIGDKKREEEKIRREREEGIMLTVLKLRNLQKFLKRYSIGILAF